MFYSTFCTAHLSRETPILHTYYHYLLPLFILQKKILRMITNNTFFAHTHNLFLNNCTCSNFFMQLNYKIHVLCIRKSGTTPPCYILYITIAHAPAITLRVPAHSLTIFQHFSYTLNKKHRTTFQSILKKKHSFKNTSKTTLLSDIKTCL